MSGEAPPPVPSGACEVTLRFERVRPNRATCFLDEQVSERTARLRFECEGGAAEVVIGDRRFTGEVRDGRLELCLATRFEFSDGCTWISSQQVYGDLPSGELAYAYRETVERGFGCASSCSGDGVVRVE